MALMKIIGLSVALAAAITAAVPWHPVPAEPPIQTPLTVVAPVAATRPPMPPPRPAVSTTLPGVYRPFGLDSGHSAFPTVIRLGERRLRMMWRHGSAHASGDGEILTSVSADNGHTWTTPQHVVVDGGGDVRDPHLGPSGLSAASGEVFLTYFVSVNGVPAGARVARSTDGGATFGTSMRIDPGYPWAAISAPVVAANGRLWTSFYAKQPGEVYQSAYAAWSLDGGASWSTVRIAIGYAGNDFQEPWVTPTAGGSVLFVFRDGNWKSLASRSISAAGVWSPVSRDVLVGATGNSASVLAANGRVYTVFRDTVSRAAKLASTVDGVSWVVERELLAKPAGAAPDSVGMTYGHPIEVAPGYIFCPIGMETSSTYSRIYLGWL